MKIVCLYFSMEVVGIGYMREDKSVRLEGEFSPILDIEEFDYWCEIPPFENK